MLQRYPFTNTKKVVYKVINLSSLQSLSEKLGVDSIGRETFIQNGLVSKNDQKAILTYSRKDIASFKLRKGMPIGCKVTLRRAKMYEFMERLIKVSLPRIRDFKGVEEKFDGKGNYTLGLKEQIIFPEIDIDKVSKVLGMEITFVTSTTKDEEARALLAAFGVPFKKK